MFTADEVFFKEFKNMMKYRESITNNKLYSQGLYDDNTKLRGITLPTEFSKYTIETYDKVYIMDIEDEHMSNLNETEALWWTKGQLTRRKFDYKGEFIKDDNGNYVTEDVDLPNDCVAIISDVNVHLPNKYQAPSGDTFIYVDMLERKFDGETQRKYIYILPRKYCHKMYQTALLMSVRRPSKFYSCFEIALTTGLTVFLSAVPFKPNKPPVGRVLRTKTSDDFMEEMLALRKYWVDNNIMFDPNKCMLSETVKGRDNMAFLELSGNIEFDDHYEEATLERTTENLMTSDFTLADTEEL